MKLGCLPYLNVRPLVYTLERGGLPEGWEFIYAPPSKLAAMLDAGEIACAPVSSFAWLSNSDFEICPEICIAAKGPVRSVLVLSKVPIDTITRVALDTSSLSGASMAKIILDESCGVKPEFTRCDAEIIQQGVPADADAALLIGDPAMLCAKDGLHVLDIGSEWMKLTGLPAVFAVWAGRGMSQELVAVLQKAKRQGMEMLDQIASEGSLRLGLSFQMCHEYLSCVISYDMGEREMESLEVFREKARIHGLLPHEAVTR